MSTYPTPTRFIVAVARKTLGENSEIAGHLIDEALAELREKIWQRREIEEAKIQRQEAAMQSPHDWWEDD